MTDLEKAQKIKAAFQEALNNGYSKEEASNRAIKNHHNGYECGDYGGITLAYCGEYIVVFVGRGLIFKEVADQT